MKKFVKLSTYLRISHCSNCGWFARPHKKLRLDLVRNVLNCPSCGGDCSTPTVGQYELEIKQWLWMFGSVKIVGFRPKGKQRSGSQLVAQERQRQISEEKWGKEHDAQHTDHELVDAAICYCFAERGYSPGVCGFGPAANWPWCEEWWKPSADSIRNLTKAAALLIAEIDRLLLEEG